MASTSVVVPHVFTPTPYPTVTEKRPHTTDGIVEKLDDDYDDDDEDDYNDNVFGKSSSFSYALGNLHSIFCKCNLHQDLKS